LGIGCDFLRAISGFGIASIVQNVIELALASDFQVCAHKSRTISAKVIFYRQHPRRSG
jgi:hypothetical protein